MIILIPLVLIAGLGIIVVLLLLSMNEITEQHSLDDEEYGKPIGNDYSDYFDLAKKQNK